MTSVPDAATGAGDRPDALAVLFSTPSVADGEPNGLFAGPDDDPDRFELLGSGRRGGEGTTWRGRFRGSLATPVTYALKQLHPTAGAGPFWPTPADLRRWSDQRHLLQTVRNDHLVRVHDVFLGAAPHRFGTSRTADGQESAVPYLVMEWIDGADLRSEVESGPGDLEARLRHVRDVADALAALHSVTRTGGNPMLHCDVKPENCVLDGRRGAVLVDLGTLRPVDGGRDPLGLHTRHYTAPEVLADPTAPRTAAGDLYGLGALAYFCVVGADPPAANEHDAVAVARSELRAATRTRGSSRDALVDLICAMLDPDPARRPSRPTVWADALCTAVRPPGRRRARVLAATMTAVVAAGGVGTVVANGRDAEPKAGMVAPFAPFGTSFASFDTTVAGDHLTISPPLGENRYDHLWGLFSPADACATAVEFDAAVGPHDAATPGFGYAVAARSSVQDDQPAGFSLQYEWSPETGSLVRPVELPGGAWRDSAEPEPMPDLAQPHHVRVAAVGTSVGITVDDHSVTYEIPETECGGIAIRAWGAPVEISRLAVSAT